MSESPEGTKRYTVKSKFGMGRDLEVLDGDGQRAFFIDGKLGIKAKAEVQDADGTVLLVVEGKWPAIPRRMYIRTPDGTELLQAKPKHFTPGHNVLQLDFHDGQQWMLTGNFIGKTYEVDAGGRRVMSVDQQFLKVRDTFVIDVADDVDQALAFAVVWMVDALFESGN